MTLTASPIPRPQPGEYAEYYHKYITQFVDGDILETLRNQGEEFAKFISSVAESDAAIVHAPYAWTIKQVISHINDGERIFAYRLLRVARGDKTPLPGFDENEYAKTAGTENLSLRDLIDEFKTIRAATLSLIENMPHESWSRTGTMNTYTVSARAIPWIMAGHVLHHVAIIRKRLAGGLHA